MFPSSKRPTFLESPPQPQIRRHAATNWVTAAELTPQPRSVGQTTALPSFAEFIKGVPVHPVDQVQHCPGGTWVHGPPLRLDVPTLSAQQSRHRLPAASPCQGDVPSLATTSVAGLEYIAREQASASELSPVPQPASPMPADTLPQTRKSPAPKVAVSTSKRPRRGPRRVNPVTGKRVLEGTPGAIAASTFYGRKLVDPVTGNPASPDTRGALCVRDFQQRKLVDPVTGEPVRPGAKNGVSRQSFRDSQPVDPVTGKSVLRGTKGAISIAAFRSRVRRMLAFGKPQTKTTKPSSTRILP
jgi:hypothetical protein